MNTKRKGTDNKDLKYITHVQCTIDKYGLKMSNYSTYSLLPRSREFWAGFQLLLRHGNVVWRIAFLLHSYGNFGTWRLDNPVKDGGVGQGI